MSILIDEKSRFLVQGITGGEGSYYARSCMNYGTKVVAGVTPGKGGILWEDEVPVFNTVAEAVKETGANASLIFVPAAFAPDAMLESADSNISPIICITEFIPTFDMIVCRNHLQRKGVRVVGPNCPGVISPGKCKAGIMISETYMPGSVGIASRSGTLTYEIAAMLTQEGIGQSTCLGLGGDPIPGTNFVESLELFEQDPETKVVILIGEIGGTQEQEAAEFVKAKMTKPVVAYVAGATAPPGRRMGHAGAIITGPAGRVDEKKKALASAGVIIAETPPEIPGKVREALASRR